MVLQMVEEVEMVIQKDEEYSKLYGFSDPTDKYSFVKTKKGLREDVVREMSQVEGRAGMDAREEAPGIGDIQGQAAAYMGRGPERDRFR